MIAGKTGDLTPPREPSLLTSSLLDVSESAPELSTESQALLCAMSKLLTEQGEQLIIALQAHQSQFIQSMEGTHLQSKIENPSWNGVSLPKRMDDENARHMVDPCPGQEHETSPSVTKMMSRPGKQSSVTDMLPEFMKARHSTLVTLKSHSVLRKTQAIPNHAVPESFQIRKCLASKVVEMSVTMIILLNAANVGAEADWSIKHANQDTPMSFQIANTGFTAFFSVELLLRIFAYRASFFWPSNRDFTWNMFDLFLVVLAIVSDAISLFVSTPNLTVIRMLRVARLVRIMRVVRVLRFFQDLRIIVAGICGAMKSLLWALGLLFMMMFLVSVCLMQVTAFELDNLDTAIRERALFYYGSLILSIYTLYQSITGGVNWGDAAQPLLDISPLLAVFFSLYVAFAVLCVLNIITGVFVENASNISTADEEQLVIEGFENRVKWFEEVKKLFKIMVGENGALDSDAFHQFLDDVKVQACFRKLGIDVHETSKNGLFQLLDFDETGMVDLEEFALGLQMLHGPAKSIDLARIRCDLKKLKRDMQHVCFITEACSNPAEELELQSNRSSLRDSAMI